MDVKRDRGEEPEATIAEARGLHRSAPVRIGRVVSTASDLRIETVSGDGALQLPPSEVATWRYRIATRPLLDPAILNS